MTTSPLSVKYVIALPLLLSVFWVADIASAKINLEGKSPAEVLSLLWGNAPSAERTVVFARDLRFNQYTNGREQPECEYRIFGNVMLTHNPFETPTWNWAGLDPADIQITISVASYHLDTASARRDQDCNHCKKRTILNGRVVLTDLRVPYMLQYDGRFADVQSPETNYGAERKLLIEIRTKPSNRIIDTRILDLKENDITFDWPASAYVDKVFMRITPVKDASYSPRTMIIGYKDHGINSDCSIRDNEVRNNQTKRRQVYDFLQLRSKVTVFRAN